MLTGADPVARKLAVLVVLTTTCCTLIVGCACCLAAWLEFTYGYFATRVPESLPAFTVAYKRVYLLGLAGPTVSVVWGCILLMRKECILLKLVLYVSTFCLYTTFWLAITLLALYVGNQSFVVH
jgi:hypothetical protein